MERGHQKSKMIDNDGNYDEKNNCIMYDFADIGVSHQEMALFYDVNIV